MKRIQLILGTVNSQALGAREEDIESTYQRAYRPALKTFYRYPQLNFTLYYSGVLLDWIDTVHSEFISALSEMMQTRRTELLVAGYYDPILPLIPKPDRLGQIEQMTTHLRKLFGRRPRGAWITQQIWEADIASSLKSAGVEYAFLDDYHFARAGFESRDMLRPCITEDQNKALTVFPVSNQFRDRFWKDSPASLVQEIIDLASETPGQVLSLLIDGEAGNWTGPEEEEGRGVWLNEFLGLILEKQQQRIIETVLPSKYMRKPAERSRGYFPATIWDEMQIWSRGPEARFTYAARLGMLTSGTNRLGFFFGKEIRQAMARYKESNLMYCKMQYVHSLVNQIRGDKYRKNAGREELWKGQNNSAFWHGRIGGIYHNRLRKTLYSNLLKAERHTREKGIFAPSLFILDYDLDGIQEILYQGTEINAYVHLTGGMLFEFDYMVQPFNYLDTMARYPEVYHLPEHEAAGYDSYLRKAFIDHFLDKDLNITDFSRAAWEDQSDFAHTQYHIDDLKREGNSVRLSASSGGLSIKKHYSFVKAQIQVNYQVTNTSSVRIETVFSPEINLSFMSCDIEDLRVYRKEGRARGEEIGPGPRELPPSQEVYFEDLLNRAVLHCQLSQAAEWWSVPVYTMHAENGWWVSSYQSSCLMPRFPLVLEPGQSFEVSINLSITRLRTTVVVA